MARKNFREGIQHDKLVLSHAHRGCGGRGGAAGGKRKQTPHIAQM